MIPLSKLKKPLTKKGHKKLADEHAHLAKVVRPKVVDELPPQPLRETARRTQNIYTEKRDSENSTKESAI